MASSILASKLSKQVEKQADELLKSLPKDRECPVYTEQALNRKIRDAKKRQEELEAAGSSAFVRQSESEEALFNLLLHTLLSSARHSRIPENVIEMLELRWSGYTFDEIAEEVGRPKETIRTLIRGAAIVIQRDPLFGLYEVLAQIFRISPENVRWICLRRVW